MLPRRLLSQLLKTTQDELEIFAELGEHGLLPWRRALVLEVMLHAKQELARLLGQHPCILQQ